MTMPLEESYREIQLTQGQVTRVSEHRYDELNAFKWCAWWNRCTKSFYAIRNINRPDGSRPTISMHREILGLETGDKRHGDHINHDTLDNRDSNLRIATHSENQRNKPITASNTSGLKGASWSRRSSEWLSQIVINGENKYLGLHSTAEEAHRAYCDASLKYHGEFGRKS